MSNSTNLNTTVKRSPSPSSPPLSSPPGPSGPLSSSPPVMLIGAGSYRSPRSSVYEPHVAYVVEKRPKEKDRRETDQDLLQEGGVGEGEEEEEELIEGSDAYYQADVYKSKVLDQAKRLRR